MAMKPKISVITPTNSLEWFTQAKRSLLWQTLPDWEWVVVWNGGAFAASDDPRIKCVQSAMDLPSVGALKREACLHATAPYIVEFDHDDQLDRQALSTVLGAFGDTGAAFVYSDCAHVYQNGAPQVYGHDYGWQTRLRGFHGERQEMLRCHDMPPLLPQNLSRIWYAPDHLRAWRADIYWEAGGHQADQRICDDLDLMARMFLISGGKFHHIDACLYRYLVHGENTWLKHQSEITDTMWRMHDRHIENLALCHWRRTHRCVDLGGGIDAPAGWEACDTHDAPIQADLNARWPFDDNSVGAFRAHDVIEHLRDPIHTMNEAWRCLAHGGLYLIEVPSTDGRGAFQDPTHVSFWNSNSFWYYTREQQQRYVRHAGVRCRFQVVRMLNYFPSQWHRTHNIPYVKVHLAAVKYGPRLHGACELQPNT
jgi:O-antigen biosynthesis protein